MDKIFRLLKYKPSGLSKMTNGFSVSPWKRASRGVVLTLLGLRDALFVQRAPMAQSYFSWCFRKYLCVCYFWEPHFSWSEISAQVVRSRGGRMLLVRAVCMHPKARVIPWYLGGAFGGGRREKKLRWENAFPFFYPASTSLLQSLRLSQWVVHTHMTLREASVPFVLTDTCEIHMTPLFPKSSVVWPKAWKVCPHVEASHWYLL